LTTTWSATGGGNENFALTAVHTVWARNHNFHVEKLLDAGFAGTAEEVFQAAKMINEAEYQRVVFTEFADKLIGGIRGDGDHGHAGYNPDATAAISHEFAAAVYRVGHSLIGQTMTVLDADGNSTLSSIPPMTPARSRRPCLRATRRNPDTNSLASTPSSAAW
jgi:hypothetical protein